MGLNNPVMSEGFVPAYQISATPFVTASNVTTVAAVTFPFVTRFFTVQNRSALELRVGFTQLGVQGTNYFVVPSGSSYSNDFRVDRLFLSSSTAASIPFVVLAGLTSVPASNFSVVTGSAGFAGVG
jgi:hypothetical protein